MALTVEQLLATLAVDQADATVVGNRVVVIQRDPQPDEIDIDIDTHIRMLIVDLDADPYDTFPDHGFTIRVEGLVAGVFGGGTFTPSAPWTGSVTDSYPPYPFVGWFVDLVQPVPGLFESEQVVDVDRHHVRAWIRTWPIWTLPLWTLARRVWVHGRVPVYHRGFDASGIAFCSGD